MAIFHLHASIVRRSHGHSAVAASAYAAGKDLYNERAEKMETYGRKRGVFHTDILAPDNAPQWAYDRQQLWNRAEQAEKRIDAQSARVFVLALPHELDDEQNITLVKDYAREMFVSEGMVVDIGMHRADRNGDQRNDHVHLVMTMRELDGDGFSRAKNRAWNRKETLEYWREQWAEYQNRALEEAGSDARVDHRTLEAQGIDREPTKHLGRQATLMERRGDRAELGDLNREIDEHNRSIDNLVSELADIDAELAAEMEAEFLPEPEISNPLNLPDTALKEIDRIRNVFNQVTGARESEAPAPRATQEAEPATVDLFGSPIVRAFESDIMANGEIKEQGLRPSLMARTLTMFENIYYNTIDYIKNTFDRMRGGREDLHWPGIDLDTDDYEPGG